ncbi:hypothetical protein [Deinococcus pimensis]|uniref:hypothetical protein n=1 Tax=Deinococcus pimensis TaxID=309888 RepID=UPI000485C3EA|nr:hypothetical protein [Deinococcus pimensis]
MTQELSFELFTHWSMECRAELLEQPGGAVLRFTPLQDATGSVQFKNLFVSHRLLVRKTRRTEEPERVTSVELLLNLSGGMSPTPWNDPDERWLIEAVASALGPLFTAHVWHGLGAATTEAIEEPLAHWLSAAEKLKELIELLTAWKKASKDVPSDETRRRLGTDRLRDDIGIDAYNTLSEERRAELARAYGPSLVSPRDQLQRLASDALYWLWSFGVSNQEDERQLILENTRPIVNQDTGLFQFNIAVGIQALATMAALQADSYQSRTVQRCKRKSCRQVRLMREKREYCSVACQQADKQAKYRARQKERASSSSKP